MTGDDGTFDAVRFQGTVADFAERSQRIVDAFLERQKQDDGYEIFDPGMITQSFVDLTARMMAQPVALYEAQANLWRDFTHLWTSTARRMMGDEVDPVIEPAPGDRRFKDHAWTDQVLFDYVKQSYLVTARWITSLVHSVEGVDDDTRRKLDFYIRQFVDACSPANFAHTNPVVLRQAMETNGENLIRGLENLLSDLEKGKGRLSISMTREDAFSIGGNLAATAGKVVFRNGLMELIQYAPTTREVARRPLLIVPPWINKYYVLDLQERNSFIRWMVNQGHTVFVISWVNPGAEMSDKTFDDYMLAGPLAALDVIGEETGEYEVNVLGYCIGGTLTACTLAWMAAKGDQRVKSATFLTTMVDFSDAGELGVFIDDEQLGRLEHHMIRKGYLEGRHMANVFNLMRDNDLIWSFVVNNYLMGRTPLPFDLLYWNSDSTRMPAMMHGFYLRKMYQENRLVEPGGITLAGEPLDLARIEVPTYILSTREDHIAPWQSTFAATRLYSGPVRFVLAGSGHIAGVINPPSRGKYCYWTCDEAVKGPRAWFESATRNEGSWWPDWAEWLDGNSGGREEARNVRDAGLGDAPGGYVKVRSEV